MAQRRHCHHRRHFFPKSWDQNNQLQENIKSKMWEEEGVWILESDISQTQRQWRWALWVLWELGAREEINLVQLQITLSSRGKCSQLRFVYLFIYLFFSLRTIFRWQIPQPFFRSACVCVLSHFSHDQLFATPQTIAHQALLSMDFSRQEYWMEKEMAAHSCVLALENPRDGGAWWAAVYGVAQSRTRLKWLSSKYTDRYSHECM